MISLVDSRAASGGGGKAETLGRLVVQIDLRPLELNFRTTEQRYMGKFILSVIVWFAIALIVAGVATLFAPINFRAWFWTVFILGFLADLFISNMAALGERDSHLPW